MPVKYTIFAATVLFLDGACRFHTSGAPGAGTESSNFNDLRRPQRLERRMLLCQSSLRRANFRV